MHWIWAIVAAVVALVIGLLIGYAYRKSVAEKRIGRAEDAVSKLVEDAQKKAEAIRKVQQALADSLEMLNEKAPNEQVVKLKAIQAMEKVADGQATKIIIPSEMQGLVGMANGLVEGVK